MNRFAIAQPKTYEQAQALLVDERFSLPVLKGGGMDLVDQMKEGLIEPDLLIDVRQLIPTDAQGLAIPARTTLAEGGESAEGITDQNLQARLRGLLLMAMANERGGLVLATGNKSELAAGYATLYGDMNGAIAVLGDVYKTDVYDLARWINANPEAAGSRSRPQGRRGLSSSRCRRNRGAQRGPPPLRSACSESSPVPGRFRMRAESLDSRFAIPPVAAPPKRLGGGRSRTRWRWTRAQHRASQRVRRGQ